MKVKTITRTAEESSRERKGDIFVVRRNADPTLHPFERAREYVRAVQAAKMDRMFAKPFVGALSGHVDGIYCMGKHYGDLKVVASGSADGAACIWNLATRRCIWRHTAAHDGFVRGLAFLPTADLMASAGQDKVVRLWAYPSPAASPAAGEAAPFDVTRAGVQPVKLFHAKAPLTSIDAQPAVAGSTGAFATSASETVAIWDVARSEALQTYAWGADTVSCVRFNRAEPALLASVASDRSLMIHDMRTQRTISKVVLAQRSNALSWNPQEAVYVCVANEDGNVYTFDMRYFDKAVNVMRGHVAAVLDVDYSPTGQEVVTAGYDKSVRIFAARAGTSRDIYHTSRMQRLFCARFTMDSKYILSGSDDGSLRIWKANAAEQLGVRTHRQQEATNYSGAVLERFKRVPEVARIVSHRRVPKGIRTRARDVHAHEASLRRKAENSRRNRSTPNCDRVANIRSDAIIKVQK